MTMHPTPLSWSGSSARSGLFAALVLCNVVVLGGCNRHEDPAETSRDMSEARQEGNEKVKEAAEEAAESMAQGASVKEAATDAYKVEAEKIRADYEVAKQRCDGVADADKDQCRKDAETARDTAMKALEARRDSVVGDESPATSTMDPG